MSWQIGAKRPHSARKKEKKVIQTEISQKCLISAKSCAFGPQLLLPCVNCWYTIWFIGREVVVVTKLYYQSIFKRLFDNLTAIRWVTIMLKT